MFVVMEHTAHGSKRGLCLANYETVIVESVYGILQSEEEQNNEELSHDDYENISQDDDESETEEDIPLHTAQTFYDQYVARTKEQVVEEEQAPQRSAKWLQARQYCLTASAFGSATGSNPYTTPEQFLQEKLWNTFKGNSATQYGSQHEIDAQASFEKYIHQFEENAFLETKNLMKSERCPWLAVSPDNLLHRKDGSIDLVEYKCPAYLRDTEHHPYRKYLSNIPPQYMDQMQGIMGYLNTFLGYSIRQAWFVVWQEKRTFITKVPYDPEYFNNSLYPKLKMWYFQKYLPALIHKHNGDIVYGEIKPVPILNLS